VTDRGVDDLLGAGLDPVEGAESVKVGGLVLRTELEAAAHLALLLRRVRANLDLDAADGERQLGVDAVRVVPAVLAGGLDRVAAPLLGERLTRR
jgi:hypothetical protein